MARVDPLYVVDGIVVSNAAIPNGQNAVSCAQCGGNPRNQDNPVNRIADLNPEDIERIEVLKGGSAAAIYGSKATNGVVIITTKRGQVGKPQFTMSQRFGFYSRANELGSRTFGSLAEALSVFSDTAGVTAAFQPGVSYNFEDELYGRQSLSYETNASVSGGTENTRYYVSGLVKDDEGIALGTGYKKQSLRSNLDQDAGQQLPAPGQCGWNPQYCRIGGCPTTTIPAPAPTWLSPLPRASSTFCRPMAFRTTCWRQTSRLTSSPPAIRCRHSTFLPTKKMSGGSWVPRRSGGHRLRSAKSTLQLSGIGGVDYFQQDNNLVSPPELQFEDDDGQPGTVVVGKSSNRNLNAALNLSHTYNPSVSDEGTQFTTSGGIQYEERRLYATQILGRTLLPGQTSPQQTTSQTVSSRLEPVRDLGIFGQEEVLLANRRLLLTAGVRADRSSSNGDTDKFFFYPKLAASYRFVRPFGGVDELKLRGAYGQTGNRAPVRIEVRDRHDRNDRRSVRHLHRQPGGRSDHPAGAAGGVRGQASTPPWPMAAPS